MSKMSKFNQRFKVLLFLPLLLGSVFLLFKYSRAQFSDSETVLGNSIQVGVWGGETTPTPPETPTPTATPTPTPPIANHLVINEVYYDVDVPIKGQEGDNEWIEIYNSTSSQINISGWKICDNTWCDTIPSSSPIPVGGFAIVTAQNSTWSYWSVPPEAIKIVLGGDIGNGLANDSDRLVLRDESEIIIDQMSYGTDTTVLDPSATDVAEGHSLERSPAGKDTDTAGDFVDRTVPTPGS